MRPRMPRTVCFLLVITASTANAGEWLVDRLIVNRIEVTFVGAESNPNGGTVSPGCLIRVAGIYPGSGYRSPTLMRRETATLPVDGFIEFDLIGVSTEAFLGEPSGTPSSVEVLAACMVADGKVPAGIRVYGRKDAKGRFFVECPRKDIFVRKGN